MAFPKKKTTITGDLKTLKKHFDNWTEDWEFTPKERKQWNNAFKEDKKQKRTKVKTIKRRVA